jgi:hypothetical protein
MARPLRRLGSANSPKVIGLVAAAVLLAALVFTGRVLTHPGSSGRRPPAGSGSAQPATANTQAPDRIGGKVDCPSLWPVLAMSNRASYPAGHPARPPARATSVACYQTTAQAASAGYAPAPLPAGALEVGGIYVTPTSRAFRVSCQQVADRLGFVVPCPGLLPSAPPGSPPPRLCGEPTTCRRGQVLRFLQGAFVVPPGYVGAPGGFSALWIVATPTRDATRRRAVRCQNERRIATPAVHRTRGVLVACLDDPHLLVLGGSVLLRWTEQGTVVVVGVLDWRDASPWTDASRWSAVNQRLAVVLANHTRLVGPRR